MPRKSHTCPDCGTTMTPGFILDIRHGGRGPADWVEGEPEPSIWTGTKLRGKKRLPVVTYRCRDCGQLKSYAVE